MALVNEGNLAGAATEFETYLKLAPDGPNAATAKSLLAQTQEVVFDSAAVRARLAGVRDRIARAAGRAGRDPPPSASSPFPRPSHADYIRAAADAGQLDFGENKVQEGAAEDAGDRRPAAALASHRSSAVEQGAEGGGRFTPSIRSTPRSCCARSMQAAAGRGTRRSTCWSRSTWPASRPNMVRARRTIWPIIEGARACRAARLIGLMLLPPAADDSEQARPISPHFDRCETVSLRMVRSRRPSRSCRWA